MEALVDTEAEAYRLAQALYNLRRKRDSALGPRRIFGEPAWDILLDLYIASKRGIWKFKAEARVDGQLATEAELMCTVRSIE